MAQTKLRDRIQSIEDAISAGRIDSAMADCQEILARYPDALEIQRLLGEVYLAQGRLEEAQQTFDWILVNDPENVIAYCDRALICEHLSDIDTALDCYQQAYELSRGNSQIRQEFNQLSAKAGQQEFMLSRAGLARLYMRGDLLTQALQEWEAVLAASPDRLDARLGLMETHWREGIYDQVEQLASRILEDIPNCEKALLLLAHVTSAFNMQRARELVQRAELLDPELVMARELFSDLAASQPHDPFLAVIKHDAIVLQEHTNGNGSQIDAISTLQYAAVEVEDAATVAQGASADRLYNWSAQDSLAELDTRTIAQAGAPPTPEVPISATWSDDATIRQAETWKQQPEPAQKQTGDDFDAWASQQEIDDDYDPALLEQQPWFQAEKATTEASPSNEQVQHDSQPGLPEVSDPWNAPAQPRKEEVSEAPAWLDMLTRNERHQPEQTAPAPQAPEPAPNTYQPQPEPAPAPKASRENDLQAAPASPETEDDALPFFVGSDDNDEDMGWPQWLKSLGAEAIEPEAEAQPSYSAWSDLQQSVSSSKANSSPFDNWLDAPQSVPAASQSQPEAAASYDPWAVQPEVSAFAAQEPARYGSWEEQIDATMSEDEKAHLATLETLEKDLFSQGFVPLQPGALSTIAQESGIASSTSNPESNVDAPVESSDEPAPTRAATQPLTSPTPAEQPWWASVPFQAPTPEKQVYTPAESAAAPVASTQPLEAPQMPVYAPAEQAVTAPVAQTPQQAPTPVLATNRVEPEAPLAPAYRADALLENELETTMRRPAVRLQPMQSAAARANAASLTGKGRPAERGTGSKSGAGESVLSKKEQLVKGYQYQLAGAYDDAMQEYRITIRNAPELLDEVISNLRALLKLAPRYTTGYRVLGDAYMRQGEYLQAMEAYNKALTMAKKAKSQSR
ncbi:MAG TPA: tetratricopeptide repeat protein [Ktedonobacteraceae bacterium]|nr:tetratricopeptide repeat protein [Ktedonobacteraceae bacterium]